jgi:transposase InsO family protein
MWSMGFMDFMHDNLHCGKYFHNLNIIDEGVREALGIEADTSLPAPRVIRVLQQIKDSYPLPEQIRVDDGTEPTSSKLIAWFETNGIRLQGTSISNKTNRSRLITPFFKYAIAGHSCRSNSPYL